MMTNGLIQIGPIARRAPRRDLAEVQQAAAQRIAELLENTTADATRAAYASDWAHFAQWRAAFPVQALPAATDTVLAYISEMSTLPNGARTGFSAATIERRLASISAKHWQAGHESPCGHERIHQVMRGIRRTVGTAPKRQKAALVMDHLRRLRRTEDTRLAQRRDRSLLLMGFAGAFRRSELVGMDVEHCAFAERTLTIALPKSKTDQEGHGRKVVIHAGGALCPIAALRAWLDAAQITSGAVFRNVRRGGKLGGRLCTRSVALLVKKYAEAVGLDPADYAGHSLRSGHVTTAILKGESAHAIMAVTGHQSRAMVDKYFRKVEPLRHNSSAGLGL
jgi:site-specific recombinase XerD